MFDYAGAQLTAENIISFFGGEGSVTRVTAPTIDPATGQGQAGAGQTITGLITPVLPVSTLEVNGTSVLQGDGVCFFTGGEVKVGDTFGGWRVVGVQTTRSPTSNIIYQRLQVRL